MIAGTVKEVITVLVAVAVFGDHLGPVNFLGLLVVIMGVALFNYYKFRKVRSGEIQVIRRTDKGLADGEAGEEEGQGLLDNGVTGTLVGGRVSLSGGGGGSASGSGAFTEVEGAVLLGGGKQRS